MLRTFFIVNDRSYNRHDINLLNKKRYINNKVQQRYELITHKNEENEELK